MCYHIVPIYFGDRPATTRGKPNESKDYYFRCYHSAETGKADYRQAATIEDLCNSCKKYQYIKPLSKEEIHQRYGPRQVMVVSRNGWYFKNL